MERSNTDIKAAKGMRMPLLLTLQKKEHQYRKQKNHWHRIYLSLSLLVALQNFLGTGFQNNKFGSLWLDEFPRWILLPQCSKIIQLTFRSWKSLEISINQRFWDQNFTKLPFSSTNKRKTLQNFSESNSGFQLKIKSYTQGAT